LAAGVSAALFARERTGSGDLVSTSLLRQGAYTVGFDVNLSLMWGVNVLVGTRGRMPNPSINHYTAGDGRRFWIVGLEGERHWPPLARAVGRPEWLEDERFSTPLGRAKHAAELVALLDEIFASKPLDEWAKIFAEDPEFFWSPVQTINELLDDPQFAASGGFVEVPEEHGSTTMLATPADFSVHAWQPRALAPELGQHNSEVLAELDG
jgi:crotonobetainyl-CoA:carnitine CoA-transferase CaiB-like acyl-CoA transferase